MDADNDAAGPFYDQADLDKLRELPELIQPHVSHVTPAWVFQDEHAELLRQWRRITGAVTLPLKLDPRHEVVNRHVTYAVAVHIVPWRGAVPAGEISPEEADAYGWGGDPRRHRDRFTQHIDDVDSWCWEIGHNYPDMPSAIRYITLDFEAWRASDEGSVNAAILSWCTQYELTLREYFPDATVLWEQKGEIRPRPQGWTEREHYPPQAVRLLGGPISAACYAPWDIRGFRETVRRTCRAAEAHGAVREFWAIISLGSAAAPKLGQYELHGNNMRDGYQYDPVFSARLGQEIAGIPYPGRDPDLCVSGVIFEPCPLRSRAGMIHFLAYARGAHGAQ